MELRRPGAGRGVADPQRSVAAEPEAFVPAVVEQAVGTGAWRARDPDLLARVRLGERRAGLAAEELGAGVEQQPREGPAVLGQVGGLGEGPVGHLVQHDPGRAVAAGQGDRGDHAVVVDLLAVEGLPGAAAGAEAREAARLQVREARAPPRRAGHIRGV